jgi:hypothetical protein
MPQLPCWWYAAKRIETTPAADPVPDVHTGQGTLGRLIIMNTTKTARRITLNGEHYLLEGGNPYCVWITVGAINVEISPKGPAKRWPASAWQHTPTHYEFEISIVPARDLRASGSDVDLIAGIRSTPTASGAFGGKLDSILEREDKPVLAEPPAVVTP